MTIAHDVNQQVRGMVEYRKHAVTTLRNSLRQFIPDSELAELNAVYSWDDDKPRVTLHLNGNIVALRVNGWLSDKDTRAHIIVQSYQCVYQRPNQYGSREVVGTVQHNKIRGAVLTAFAIAEADDHANEIVPSADDEQPSSFTVEAEESL